ncbi:LAQU0S03e05072g1_1 [Lachancea quebecensis]|uniref:Ubiquitin carboxyl-terminal hydrolase n=1 Tax=Lachancea quebecensis TaxID=1654605 RepID=A0A0P1KPJ3_9SACH|nr:LAQU0S03e05072g1_1 [Lachancea quebecensis]
MSLRKWLSRSDKPSRHKPAAQSLHSEIDPGAKYSPAGTAKGDGAELSLGGKILSMITPSDGSNPSSSCPDGALESGCSISNREAGGHSHGSRDASGATFEQACHSSSAISDFEDLESEYDYFPLIKPSVTSLLPYGDGSNKVFGYENFGNTCYCNSVLQVIYNLPELRINLLEFPERPSSLPRRRKSEMPGIKPRIFDDTSFTHSNNGNENTKRNSSTSGSVGSLGKEPSRKTSASSLKPGISARAQRLHNASVVHGTVMASDAITEKLHEGFTRIVVGRVNGKSQKKSAQKTPPSNSASSSSSSVMESSPPNISLASSTRPEETSSEERKSSALIRGPVLNVDHSLIDYLPQGEKPGLYTALKDLYESITENKFLTGVVSPIQFVETLKRENVLFSSTMHQDAHEFLNFLLNDISDYINAHSKNNLETHETENSAGDNCPNFVDRLFKGTLTNRTKCLTCDNMTYRNEPFLDFAIEVQDDGETDIQTTLADYHQKELLNGANKFYCDECCGLQEAERVVGLKQLPFYLALHMKRFKYSEEQNCNVKLFNRIRYPLDLKVCSTFDASVCKQYELVGLVVHMGGGPHHGHYVSLCKNERFGWLLFDDETVETVNESTVLKFVGNADDLTTAYLLFYREKTAMTKIDNDKSQEYAECVDELIKLDEKIRVNIENSKSDQSTTLEEVPEERRGERKLSSRGSKRRSRIFSFKRSPKD